MMDGKGTGEGRAGLAAGDSHPQIVSPSLLTSWGKLGALAAAGDGRQVLVDLLEVHRKVFLSGRASQELRGCLRGRALCLGGGARSLRAQVLPPSRGAEEQ